MNNINKKIQAHPLITSFLLSAATVIYTFIIGLKFETNDDLSIEYAAALGQNYHPFIPKALQLILKNAYKLYPLRWWTILTLVSAFISIIAVTYVLTKKNRSNIFVDIYIYIYSAFRIFLFYGT